MKSTWSFFVSYTYHAGVLLINLIKGIVHAESFANFTSAHPSFFLIPWWRAEEGALVLWMVLLNLWAKYDQFYNFFLAFIEYLWQILKTIEKCQRWKTIFKSLANFSKKISIKFLMKKLLKIMPPDISNWNDSINVY